MDTFTEQLQDNPDSGIPMNSDSILVSLNNGHYIFSESNFDNKTKVVSGNLDNYIQHNQSYESVGIFDFTCGVADVNSLSQLYAPENLPASSQMGQGNIVLESGDDFCNTARNSYNLYGYQTTDTARSIQSGKLATLLQVPTFSNLQIVKNLSVIAQVHSKQKKSFRNLATERIKNNCDEIKSLVSIHNKSAITHAKENLSEYFKSHLQLSSPEQMMATSVFSLQPVANHSLTIANFPASGCSTEAYNNCSFDGISNDIEEQTYASVQSKFTKHDYMNARDSSILINIDDAFQMSLKDLDSQIDMDTVNGFAYSRCSANFQDIFSFSVAPGSKTAQEKKSDFILKDTAYGHFNNSRNFVDCSLSMPDVFTGPDGRSKISASLSNSPMSTSSETHVQEIANLQSMSQTEQLIFHQSSSYREQHLASSTPSTRTNSGSNDDSFDNDTFVQSSLLRTLLGTKGEFIQGPLTYTEWVIEKTRKKKRETKKTKTYNYLLNSKYAVNRRIRRNKNCIKTSTELPLPRLRQGLRIKYERGNLVNRKPTKELPLPSSALTPITTTVKQSYFPYVNVDDDIHKKDALNKDLFSDESLIADCGLPVDLLDMAMEFCVTMGTDQTEALFSDLNDNFSFEDNLSSLLDSHIQDCNTTYCSRKQDAQLLSENSVPTSNLHLPEQLNSEDYKIVSLPSAFPPNKQMSLLQEFQVKSPEYSIRDVDKFKLPSTSSTKEAKLNLLRAAVTTTDVDKFIQQIPVASSKKYNLSAHIRSEHTDVDVAKIAKNQKPLTQRSTKIHQSKLSRQPSPNGKTLSRQLFSPNPCCSHKTTTHALDHVNAAQFDQLYENILSENQVDSSEQLLDSTVPHDSNSITEQRFGSSPYVLKISIHQSSPTKKVRRFSQKNITQTSKSTSLQATHRDDGVSVTGQATNHPITVMIMCNKNKRPRRSKTAAVQTDNESDGIYPECEHSPSDTILYPSVMFCSNNSLSSSSQSKSSASSLSPSPPMFELESCVYRHPSSDSSFPGVDIYHIQSNTSFLKRLLLGELNTDQYQRLDQKMLEDERKLSVA